MKVLMAHNHYGNNSTGGEAIVFESERSLLQNNGIEILKYERTNYEIKRQSLLKKLLVFYNIHWSNETIKKAGKLMDSFKPDILHVHNYKFLITPSIFKAAKDRGIKTVLTLHNYRLMVPCGNFMTKNGEVCELCLSNSPLRILWKRCTQGSLPKSYLQYRLFKKTKYDLVQLVNLVDCYIVLSEFAREKLIKTGIPPKKIIIKPNFVYPLHISSDIKKHERAVFIGRMSFEKGLTMLLKTWANIDYPLYILGEGPLEKELRKAASLNSNIVFLDKTENIAAKQYLMESAFLVFPSTWYEGMPLTILESLACGVPVIATDLGPRREIIKDGETGLLYNPNNSVEFIEKVNLLISDKKLREKLGLAAKKEFIRKYSPEQNLKLLINIYQELLN